MAGEFTAAQDIVAKQEVAWAAQTGLTSPATLKAELERAEAHIRRLEERLAAAKQCAREWEAEWRRCHREFEQALHDMKEGKKPQGPTGRGRALTLSDDLI